MALSLNVLLSLRADSRCSMPSQPASTPSTHPLRAAQYLRILAASSHSHGVVTPWPFAHSHSGPAVNISSGHSERPKRSFFIFRFPLFTLALRDLFMFSALCFGVCFLEP